MSTRLDVERTTPYQESFRTEKVRSQFDIPEQETLSKAWTLDLDLPHDWTVGLIVGPSGSGKTTVAHEAWPDATHYDGSEPTTNWPHDQAIVDAFPQDLDVRAITETLSRVGFSSPPAWLQPYQTLSTGQRFRADMAHLLSQDHDGPVIIDEFTSVVDRTVAKSISHAVQKYARRDDQPIVLVTCHYDVQPWLEPDWVIDMADQSVVVDPSFQRPKIHVDIHPTHRQAWKVFREHHYLDHSISDATHCYVATWDDRPVTFVGVLHQPHPTVGNLKRVTRLVTLPPFQGLGIGTQVLTTISEYYRDNGYRVIIITSHPGLMVALDRDEDWRCIRSPSRASQHRGPKQTLRDKGSHKRKTATFECHSGGPESLK